MDNTNKTQAKKKKDWESSDNETEEKSNYFPFFFVMESAEEIPSNKVSLYKMEKILSKSLKPKTFQKLKNGTLLIEICKKKKKKPKKNQAAEILKWKHFHHIKIKTYPHISLNTCKRVVKIHELS